MPLRSCPTGTLLPLIALLGLSPSCTLPAADAPAGDPEIAARLGSDREALLVRYRTEKARLEGESVGPRAIEYDGLGSIIVHETELRGGPDRPYLRTRFTYVNTSGRTLRVPTIRLVFIDREGRRAVSASRTLSRTMDDTIANDMAHTAWIDLDIGERYLLSGWDWTIELATEPEAGVEAPRPR